MEQDSGQKIEFEKETGQKSPFLFVKKKLVAICIALGVLVAVAAVVAGFVFIGNNGSESNPDEQFVTEDQKTEFRHPLTGAKIDLQIESLPRVFAVMIENAADSWPQAGLEDAFLVIEAPVEASIPRFVAFYSEEDSVEKIGPVRSARPYYLDWSSELDSMYAHVGGSPESISLIPSIIGVLDLNEFYNAPFFWRSSDRSAPHNVYTSIDLLRNAFQKRTERATVGEPSYEPWIFADSAEPEGRGNFSQAEIRLAPPTYTIIWRYDKETNKFERRHGSFPHKSEDGDRIYSDNVVIVETDVSVLDAVGRRKIRTTGEGNAILLQNGFEKSVKWKKEKRSDRLRFFDSETGEEMRMNAGKTWIEIVPSLEIVVSNAGN
ncbi:MAG: hypothetical protein ACD_76C00161G0001 [uncultured bacterium]|nr:MAG: hypothetical protein ACD_76C00161G0001 [uncultured bacterium]